MALQAYLYLMTRLCALKDEENGATMIEYGLLAALLAVALIGTVGFLSGALDGIFTTAGTELEAAAQAGGGGA